jgi:hypothetical protein
VGLGPHHRRHRGQSRRTAVLPAKESRGIERGVGGRFAWEADTRPTELLPLGSRECYSRSRVRGGSALMPDAAERRRSSFRIARRGLSLGGR